MRADRPPRLLVISVDATQKPVRPPALMPTALGSSTVELLVRE